MFVSVVICTWNRASLLDETLKKLMGVAVPDNLNWELVIIDNNSTDTTADIIKKYEGVLPIVAEYERRPGLSNARNKGLEVAGGDYIIWTDDDVLVDKEWLMAYVEGFHKWRNAGVFGGKVLPWFESAPPVWLKENLDLLNGCFALRDFGNDEQVLKNGNNPFGANMAFKAETLKRFSFNPELGRKQQGFSGGEETEIINRIRELGEDVVWLPTCSVLHYLPKKRMTLRYIRQYNISQGFDQSRHEIFSGKSLLGAPLWLWRKWYSSEIKWFFQLLAGKPTKIWLRSMIDAAQLYGVLRRAKGYSA